MHLRRVVYSEREQFLLDYLKDFPTGGLFVPGDDACSLGEPVLIEIVFPDIPEGIFLSGRAVWRRLATRWKSVLPSGVGVQFDGTERAKRDFVLDYATGALSALRKRTRRIPARLRVDYGPPRRELPGVAASTYLSDPSSSAETRDIGRGGLFLKTESVERFGASVQMILFPPGPLLPTPAMGRVAWTGNLQGNPGMGIQFLFRTRDARQEIDRIVSGLEDQLILSPPSASV